MSDDDFDINDPIEEYVSAPIKSSNKNRQKGSFRGFDRHLAQLLSTKLDTYVEKKKLLLQLDSIDDWKMADPMSELFFQLFF